MKLWPISLFWGDMPKVTRITFICIVTLYLIVASIKLFDSVPHIKELQILQIVENHSELGFSFTKGYNLYSESDYRHRGVFGLDDRWGLNLGGVPFDDKGEYKVYISCTPGFVILSTIVYDIMGGNWRVIKVLLILFGVLVLYGFLLLALKYFEGNHQIYFLILTLTPFTLMHYYYSDINLNSFGLGLTILSYLAFLRFIETQRFWWLISAGIIFFINVWSSFFTLCIVPVIIIHLLLDKRLSGKLKLNTTIVLTLILGVTLGTIAIYYANLSGEALSRLSGRVIERVSGGNNISIAEETGRIPWGLFFSRLVIRLNTHFNPIAFLLGFYGLLLSIYHVFLKNRTGPLFRQDTVANKDFVNIMFFVLGLPASVILMSGSYVHPYFIYYLSMFFTFSSTIGLISINKYLTHNRYKKLIIWATLSVFGVISVVRSILKLLGMSLIDLFFQGQLPTFYIG